MTIILTIMLIHQSLASSNPNRSPNPYPNPVQVTMVLVHELGAVLSFASPSTPLRIGDEIDVAPTAAGELSVV